MLISKYIILLFFFQVSLLYRISFFAEEEKDTAPSGLYGSHAPARGATSTIYSMHTHTNTHTHAHTYIYMTASQRKRNRYLCRICAGRGSEVTPPSPSCSAWGIALFNKPRRKDVNKAAGDK